MKTRYAGLCGCTGGLPWRGHLRHWLRSNWRKPCGRSDLGDVIGDSSGRSFYGIPFDSSGAVDNSHLNRSPIFISSSSIDSIVHYHVCGASCTILFISPLKFLLITDLNPEHFKTIRFRASTCLEFVFAKCNGSLLLRIHNDSTVWIYDHSVVDQPFLLEPGSKPHNSSRLVSESAFRGSHLRLLD